MKSLEDLASRGTSPAGEFASLARYLMIERGNLPNAADRAAGARAPDRVVEVLRTAIPAGGGSTWGSQLTAYRLMANAFLDTLRTTSAFYRILGDNGFVRLPFEVQLGAILTGAAASVVDPGQAISVSKLNLAATQLDRIKAASILALSRELLEAAPAAESLISRSLRGSVSLAVDQQFVSIITAGVTPSTATANPLTDLRTLATAVAPTQESRLYFLAAPDVGIKAATVVGVATNEPAFPTASFVGGTLVGVPMLVTSAVSPGQLVLVDASGIGAASDPIELDASQQVTLEMDSAPTSRMTGPGSPDAPVGTSHVSMFATNSAAIRAVAYVGMTMLRPGGVAVVSNVQW